MEAQAINPHFSTTLNSINPNFLAKIFPRSPTRVSCKSPNLSFVPQFGTSLKKGVSLRSSCFVKAKMGCDGGDELGEGVGRKKLAVFVSGGGSNFRSIHEAILDGRINGDIAVLVASKAECGGANYARKKGIPVIVFPKTKSGSEGLSPHDLANALRKCKVDNILLAGYLKLIPAELIRAYPKSILNIHPSLLPSFGDTQGPQSILLMNIMTLDVSLLRESFQCFLLIRQRSWLQEFFKRNIKYMWR